MKIMKYSVERKEMRKKRDKDTVELSLSFCVKNTSNNEGPSS